MTIHERGARWLLALLKPNCIGIAKRNLARQGFRTFLPMESGTRRVQGRFVDGLRPLFPGYIFVAHDPDRLHWRSIHSTSGIGRLVCFGKEPTEVPLDLVGELMRRCDAAGTLLPPKIVKPGDPVRLAAGPFSMLHRPALGGQLVARLCATDETSPELETLTALLVSVLDAARIAAENQRARGNPFRPRR